MANTRRKDTSKANALPASQNPGSGDVQHTQRQTQEVITHQDKHQPTTPGAEREKPARGRGHPKKTTAIEPPIENGDKEPVASKIQPRKRTRKAAGSTDEIESQPDKKRTKTDNAEMSNGLHKAPPTVQRDPLPDRPGRNVHPALKTTTTRRTSQEVEAERRAKRKAIEEKIQQLEHAKHLLAEMNVAEDIQDDGMNLDNPQRFSAAIRKRQHAEIEGDSNGEEVFDFRDVDEMLCSSEGEESAMQKMPKKKGKATKGALRKEVQDMVGRIRGEDGGREYKKTKLTNFNGFPTLDNQPKVYRNSGLQKGFKAKKSEENVDPFQSGGLDDEDASSTRPAFPRTKDLPHRHPLPDPKEFKRDCSRKNDLVRFELQESDGHAMPKEKKLKAKGTKTTKARVDQLKPDVPVNPKPGPSGNTNRNADEFLNDRRWARVFIPTITHALYVSEQPFGYFRPDSPNFLQTVQAAFNRSFPNVRFTLSPNDEIIMTAYERIKSRKSKLAKDVLDLVRKFFQGPEFEHSADIRNYVHWALRPGGPAYYAVPTPVECKVGPKDPGYTPPERFLESSFIVPIARQYLKYASNSVLIPPIDQTNPPKGLYALILTAVERGFSAHRSGSYVAPPQFNHDNCWKPLEDFFRHINKLKGERWNSILQLRGIDEGEKSDVEGDSQLADQSMISAYRAELYIPSSPIKQ